MAQGPEERREAPYSDFLVNPHWYIPVKFCITTGVNTRRTERKFLLGWAKYGPESSTVSFISSTDNLFEAHKEIQSWASKAGIRLPSPAKT